MSHVLSLVNTFAAGWADAFARACWQGGLVIALVWATCRLWPAMPPISRCWLWRLAYAKLLLGLVWLPPLALPLLPKPAAPQPLAQAFIVQEQPALPPAVADMPPPNTLPPNAMVAAPQPLVPFPVTPAIIAPRPAPPVMPTLQALLLTGWLLGALASLTRVASAWRRALTLSRTSTPIADDALHADGAELCRRLGLRRVPPLRVSGGIPSPLLLGLGRPAVLLPAFVLFGSPRAEVKLMLAHELAHLARRDLLWDIVPQLAQRLFFFHPLVWLAGHEWALAQEIACDALAVQTTGAPLSAYGRMLLAIATRRRDPAAPLFPTLAVAAPRHTLRRRLFAMQHIGTVSRPRLILAAALTAALAIAGLLPWRVVAQAGPPLPAAMKARMAQQEKQRANYAIWEAQTDAQLAEALKRLPPAQQKEAQARIVSMNDYIVKSQKRTRMMEQHRADFMATHPYKLSNAQAADISRLLDLNIRRNGLNGNVAWGRVLRVKLLADVAAAHDATSKKGYRAQIAAVDKRRLGLEQEMRLLEPRIAQQKAVVALIPEDQRTLMGELRHYDIDVWCGRIEALAIKQSRLSVLHQWLATKPSTRGRRGAVNKASLPAPQARTASFDTVASGGPPPARLAQSVTVAPVPPGVTQTEAKWEELERKQEADTVAWNAKADTQLDDIQRQSSPARLKAVRSQIAFAKAEYAKEQKRVKISEQSRTAYIASHPNRLSDAQITLIQKANWEKMHHRSISEEVRAELAAIPKDQRDRVATLRSYDGEISGGRMMALIGKQAWVQVLRQQAAGKGQWPVQPGRSAVKSLRSRAF